MKSTPSQACSIDDIKLFSFIGSPVLTGNGNDTLAVVETIRNDCLGYNRDIWKFSESADAQKISFDENSACRLPEVSSSGKHIAFTVLNEGKSLVQLVDTIKEKNKTLLELDGTVTALRFASETQLVLAVDQLPLDEVLGIKSDAPIKIDWLNYKKDGRPGFNEPTTEIWTVNVEGSSRLMHSFLDHVTCLDVASSTVYVALEKRHSNELVPSGEVIGLDLDTGQLSTIWKSPSIIDDLIVTDRSQHLIAVAAQHFDNRPRMSRLWRLDMEGSANILFPSCDLEVEYGVQGDSHYSGKSPLVKSIGGSDEILFVATEGSDVALFLGDPAKANPRRITKHGWSVTDFAKSRRNTIAVCLESATKPAELFLLKIDSNNETEMSRLTDLNGQWIQERNICSPGNVEVVGFDGVSLSGYLLSRQEGEPSPLLVRIHGGPHLCYGNGFDFEAQVAFGSGLSVLLPNLRGSAGRGNDFRALTIGNWGDKDYDDLIRFVDYAENKSFIDSNTIFVQGGSYGGYLTNWALTRTNRFKAAISERSISNLLSKFGTSDNGFSTSILEMGGKDIFGEDASFLVERSPIFSANNIRTPVLLLHGETDHRCPIEQSEQLFVALRRLGKEVVLVRFPNESHSLSYFGRPDHRIARLSLIMSWFHKYR